MLIIFKFDWNLVTKPPPFHISLIWLISITVLILWTIWHFFIYPRLKLHSNFCHENDSSHQYGNKSKLLLESASQENKKLYNNKQNGQIHESLKLKKENLKKIKKYI